MGYRRQAFPSHLAASAAMVGAGVVGRYLKARKYARSLKKTSTKSVATRASRKRRGALRVKSTRRSKETIVPAAEYTRNTVSLGYKPRQNLRNAWKLLNQNKSSTIYGYRALSAFGGSNGNLSLTNVSPTTSTGPWAPPCHLFDLTSAINVVNGVATSPNIWFRPQFSDPTAAATLSWGNTQNWTLENTDHAPSIVDTYPNGSDTLDWVQAKLMCYCPLQLPSRFQIDVVQFKDTRLIPGEGTSQFAAAFWQGVNKRFSYSPLEGGDYKYQKYFKTLYTNTFILNPKENTEAVNTIFREVNIFMRLNRRCTYDWEDQDRMNMVASADFQQNDGTNIKTTVHPRARIYLMIRAQSGWGTAFSNAIMPSYDIVLRTKHTQLAG